MFGNCCNTCCPADSNRGLFGICLNDAAARGVKPLY